MSSQSKKVEMILLIRLRIKFLEEFLVVPTHDAASGNRIIRRDERWMTYFDTKKDNVFAKGLKKRIKDAGLDVDKFCRSMRTIYGDFSDRTVHRVLLSKKITEEDIDNVLKLIGVYGDEPAKIAVQVLITPLEGTGKSDSSSSDDE